MPVKDELDTLEKLFENCRHAIEELGIEFEMIFVDDGSTDESWRRICEIQAKYETTVKAVRLRRNSGKAVALFAGFELASAEVVFTLDADLQDDPKEIGKFLEKLAEGYDCVSGWKINRQDSKSKTLPSLLFNRITAFITGIELHDFNCGFKAYRSEVVKSVEIYGELQRYIPVLASDYGYRIGEVAVKHHPFKHGQSKYGWERYARGLLDLITVMATTRYLKNRGTCTGGLASSLVPLDL